MPSIARHLLPTILTLTIFTVAGRAQHPPQPTVDMGIRIPDSSQPGGHRTVASGGVIADEDRGEIVLTGAEGEWGVVVFHASAEDEEGNFPEFLTPAASYAWLQPQSYADAGQALSPKLAGLVNPAHLSSLSAAKLRVWPDQVKQFVEWSLKDSSGNWEDHGVKEWAQPVLSGSTTRSWRTVTSFWADQETYMFIGIANMLWSPTFSGYSGPPTLSAAHYTNFVRLAEIAIINQAMTIGGQTFQQAHQWMQSQEYRDVVQYGLKLRLQVFSLRGLVTTSGPRSPTADPITTVGVVLGAHGTSQNPPPVWAGFNISREITISIPYTLIGQVTGGGGGGGEGGDPPPGDGEPVQGEGGGGSSLLFQYENNAEVPAFAPTGYTIVVPSGYAATSIQTAFFPGPGAGWIPAPVHRSYPEEPLMWIIVPAGTVPGLIEWSTEPLPLATTPDETHALMLQPVSWEPATVPPPDFLFP